MNINNLPENPDMAAAELLRRAALKGHQGALEAFRAARQPSAEAQVHRATIAQFMHDRSAAYRGAAKMTEFFREKFAKENDALKPASSN